MSFNPDAGSISSASDAALNNPADNQLLSYDQETDKWVNQTASISMVDGLQTALDDSLGQKNNVVELTDSTNDDFVRINITDDATPSSEWPDRFAFYFNGTRSGYFNEYGEIRARPAKPNTVGMRAMGHWQASDSNDIFQVSRDQGDTLLGVSKKYLTNNGLIKNNTYDSDPGAGAGAYLEKYQLNYTLNTTNSEIRQVWVQKDSSNFKASWHNEWGALRGTAPYPSYGDALVRGIRTNSDSISNGNAVEIVDRRPAENNIMWGRSWVDGSLVRNGHGMADTYVMENGGTPPSTLPVGTVIIELDE